MEVSAGVRVAEKNGPLVAHAGSAAERSRRQIAYEPAIRSSVSRRAVVIIKIVAEIAARRSRDAQTAYNHGAIPKKDSPSRSCCR